VSAILPSLDLVVNRITTITVVQSGPQLKSTLAATPTETVVRTSSNVGIHRINTTPVLSNTVAVAYPNSSLLGAQFAVVDSITTTTSANANSFAVTGATSVLGGGLNYTYGSIVSNVSAYVTETYTTPGTYTWTCPEGVTSISMVGVGGGGGGQQKAAGGSGGAGGLIDYYNAYAVTPGTSYTIVVGGRGGPGTVAGDNGDATYFIDAAATAPVIYAAGGTGGGNMSWLTGGTAGSIINSTYSSIDTFTAQDSNGGTITYSVANGPTGLVINSSTGVLSYTQQVSPSLSDGYLITINATSTSGSSIDKFYTLIFTAESYLYYLLVAGGGGAGTDGSVSAASPGTGGGGGVVLGSIGITLGSGLVTIGSGGSLGSNGGNTSAIGTSVFGTNGVVAIGGGAGGSALTGDSGQPGGSGGGGGYSPSVVSGAGGAGLQPSSTWGGYGTGGAAGNQGGLGGSAGGTNLTSYASGSLFFTSTSALLTVPANAKFNFGTGDFTIEFWAYRTISAAFQMVMNLRAGVGSTPNGCWWIDNNGTSIIRAAFYTQGGTLYSAQGANTQNWPAINTWYHFAVVRYVNDLGCYLNGVRIGGVTVLSSDAFGSSTIPLYMGKFTDSTLWTWNGGYITNARLVKGTAVYTTAFVPTVPLSNITNTSLLLLVASDANKIIDSSTSPSTLTNNAVTYSSTIIPSASNTAGTRASGSLVFNGSSYVSYPTNAAWAFGGGNFTVECWFYQTAYAAASTGNSLVFLWRAAGGRAFNFYVNSSGSLGVGWTNASGTMAGGSTSLNTWYHAAFVRNGASFYLYLNGAQVATTAAVTLVTSSDPLFIGANNDGGTPTWFFRGYITNVRIVKGTAVYTSAFAPTVPLAAVSGTSLLLTVANNTNRAVDSSSNNFTPTISGATFSSTVVPTIGATVTTAGGSLLFNGTSQTLTFSAQTALSFGTGDLTIEMWVYPTSLAPDGIYAGLIDARSGDGNTSWNVGLFVSAGNMYAYMQLIGATGNPSGTTIIPLNAWTHIAWTRQSSTFKIFVNGVVDYTASETRAIDAGGTSQTIGRHNEAGRYYRGYLTNIRIVKGTAAYTSAFIPTVSLTNITNTSLLLLVNSDFTKITDSSSSPVTLTNVGAVTYNGTIVPTVAGTSGPIAVNILGNVIARYSDGGYAANSSVNYGGGGGRVGYGVAGNAGVAYFWYAGAKRSPSGDLIQSISYGGTNYWLHKFVNSQYLNLYQIGLNPPALVDYIVVGGGGGGGYTQISSGSAGGGGAGGIITTAQYSTYLNAGVVSATNSAFATGTSDFTVEGWAWIDPACDALGAFVCSVSSSQQGFLVYRDGGGGVINANGAGGSAVSWLTALPTSTWFHFALTMQSNTIRLYKDGVYQGSTTNIYSNNSTTIALGTRYTNNNSWPFVGYITNVRVVSGTALYTTTGTFAVATTPLTAISGTVYLTATTATLQDMGPNQVSVIGTGTVGYSASQIPFASTAAFAVTQGTSYTVTVGAGGAGGTTGNGSSGSNSILGTVGGSLSFSGSNNVSVPYSAAAFQMTGDFTIECWIYPTSYSGPSAHARMIFSNGGQSGGDTDGYSLLIASSGLFVITKSGSGNYSQPTAGIPPLNAWTHVAYVRSGGNHNLWFNGVFNSYTGNQITGSIGNSGYPFYVGDESVNSRYNDPFAGYITNVRVVNGTAVYTTALYPSGFTPAVPLNVTNTKLLLNVITSALYITDTSSSPLTPVNNGGVTFSTLAPSGIATGVYATGGGGGGYAANASPYAYAGLLGGSGGGGGGGTAAGTGGAAMAGQGFAGAAGSSTSSAFGGGGGGGGGGAGLAGSASAGGAGGVGAITPLITTTQANTAVIGQVVTGNVYFGGGGGGGVYASTAIGAGGIGGGAGGGSVIVSGSLSFNGSSYLTAGATTDWTFMNSGLQDYTMECWFYTNTLATGYQELFATGSWTVDRGVEVAINGTLAGQVAIVYTRGQPGSNTGSYTVGGLFTASTWNHMAATFVAGTKILTIFVNGVEAALTTGYSKDLSAFPFSASAPTSPLTIGKYAVNGTSGGFFNGYITNLRITKSILYTGSNPGIPSLPLTNLGASTTLLLLGASVVDSSSVPFTLTNTTPPVTISTSVVPTAAVAAAGTVNTGGGGGGAGAKSGSGSAGGAGGAGVVVIRYPDTYNIAASTTGSPILETANGYRTYIFKTSGSITF